VDLRCLRASLEEDCDVAYPSKVCVVPANTLMSAANDG
jgi:hypothetical protein